MRRGSSRLPPNGRRAPSGLGFPSTLTAARVRAGKRPAPLRELPIALWDERLSTAAVERELIAANVTRARRARVIDQHAAAYILQGALDRLACGALAH